MTANKAIETEMKSLSLSQKSTDYLARVRRQMMTGGIRKERLELILKSLGYKQTKIGNWEKTYEKND